MPELFVTNFNRNFTGVSATAANVIRQQVQTHDLALVGRPLPGCPEPIPVARARALSRQAPPGRPFSIWHVRRNTEMRAAIWARDVLRLPLRIVFTSAAQRRHSALPRWLISRMDAVIATTEEAAGFVPHVRAVVPHGVDTDLFTPAEDRAAAWAAQGVGGTLGIATIGRIRPEKGTDLFVEAMLRLLPDLPGAVALVLGRAAREHQGFLAGLKDADRRRRSIRPHPVSRRGSRRRSAGADAGGVAGDATAALRGLWHGASGGDGQRRALRRQRGGLLPRVFRAGPRRRHRAARGRGRGGAGRPRPAV